MSSRHSTTMTIYDAEHYSDAEREAIIASYPLHERKARVLGIPALGSGRVFPFDEEDILEEPFDIPSTFKVIGAMDFGGSGEDGHPTAAVKLAFDPDMDVLHVTHEYRKKGGTTIIHAGGLKPWGDQPWAWPRDGLKSMEVGNSSMEIRQMYEHHGLNMLPEYAQFEDGSVGVEAGIQEMYERMVTGRFKVFRHLNMWRGEFRLYHRKEGVIQKTMDDLMDATRYGVMMRGYAEQERQRGQWKRPQRAGIL